MSQRPNPDEEARSLAGSHFASDPELELILFAPGQRKIRLIEVTRSVGTTNEIFPVQFGPDPARGIHFPSEIILLSPVEWELLSMRQLRLPKTWGAFDKLERIPRAS